MTRAVHILTGYLGSGKTTLLSRLLRDPALADTAVVINELGEVGLDHVLVGRGSEDDVVLLDSGCLCCALGNSLQETLESLHYRRERGELPNFSRVVVETTIASAMATWRRASSKRARWSTPLKASTTATMLPSR